MIQGFQWSAPTVWTIRMDMSRCSNGRPWQCTRTRMDGQDQWSDVLILGWISEYHGHSFFKSFTRCCDVRLLDNQDGRFHLVWTCTDGGRIADHVNGFSLDMSRPLDRRSGPWRALPVKYPLSLVLFHYCPRLVLYSFSNRGETDIETGSGNVRAGEQ